MKFANQIEKQQNLINNSHDYYPDFLILGSGASMNYFKPNDTFFFNKITIGINMIWQHFRCDYVVIHHHELLDKIIDHMPERFDYSDFFVSRFHCGITGKLSDLIKSPYDEMFTVFEHNNQTFLNDLDFSAQDHPAKLVTGGTTAIDAISLAVRLGAKNIFLCGIDGGALDGETNLKGYFQAMNSGNKEKQRNHSIKTNKLIMDFRDYLKTRGVNMFSINPFVNMGFEGHILK